MMLAVTVVVAAQEGLLASNFLMNKLGKKALQFILGMLSSLQVIFYLPLMAVVMPSNVVACFKILVPFATMDFVDTSFFNKLFTFDQNYHNDDKTHDQAVEMGYKHHNSLLNLRTFGLVTIMYHIKVFLYPILGLQCWKSTPISAKIKALKLSWSRKMFFTEILSLLFIGHFELLISGYFTW